MIFCGEIMSELKPTHYVSNKDLYAAMCIYLSELKLSIENNEERPVIPDDIANAIIRIATNMSNLYNFIGYSFRDEMISDAILKCMIKIDRFDPNRGENPFAYFSQICWNEYITRIKIEQREHSVKAALIQQKLSSEFVQQSIYNDVEVGNAFVEFLEDNDIFVDRLREDTEKDQTGLLHPSLRHKNKTPYTAKKQKEQNNGNDICSLLA
jgi:hypothetical protein